MLRYRRQQLEADLREVLRFVDDHDVEPIRVTLRADVISSQPEDVVEVVRDGAGLGTTAPPASLQVVSKRRQGGSASAQVRAPTTLSLFTGAGGLDLGLEAAGFVVAGCVEVDPDCRRTLARNSSWPVIEGGDLTARRPADVLDELGLAAGELTMVSAGPPCQPFSKASQWRSGQAQGMAHRFASTLHSLVEVIDSSLPEVVLIENVTGFLRSGSGNGISGLDVLTAGLERVNIKHDVAYAPAVFTFDAADYGVPQHRRRVFVVASRRGGAFELPAATHGRALAETGGARFSTTWDAIGDLADGDEGLAATGAWAELLPSIPEGQNYQFHTTRGDGEPLFGWRTRYWSFLLKLAKNRPAWTIQASPGSATGPFHWSNRRLSVRELARLQTFPDAWELAGGATAGRRQIGNAVPVAVGELLGSAIRRQLLGHPTDMAPLTGIPKHRSDCPAPEAPAVVPERYLDQRGTHPEHPGRGLGPGATRRLEAAAKARVDA